VVVVVIMEYIVEYSIIKITSRSKVGLGWKLGWGNLVVVGLIRLILGNIDIMGMLVAE
jgi:hypothetical protein